MAHEICEGMWLQRVLDELKISSGESMMMYCDNQATLSIAKNPVHHDRPKHVEIDCHFIKEKIEGEIISLINTPSSSQTAEIFTKALPRTNFEDFKSKLGMINISNPA